MNWKKKKKKSKTKDSEPTPSKIAPFDPHPSGSEDIPISHTGVLLESKNSQVPLEAPSTMAPEGSSFDEVAREALKAAEKVI